MKINQINLNKLAVKTVLVILATVGFTGCAEEESTAPLNEEQDIELAQLSSFSETLVEEDIVMAEMSATASSTGGRTYNELSCALITRNTDTQTIVIDFGDGCIGPYGRERSGKIIITYGGEFNDARANRLITFEEYVVNNNQISGNIELRDINRNDTGNLTATRKLTGYTILFPDGSTYEANGQVTREWIQGEGDQDPSTNVSSLTGSYEGIFSGGLRHTIDITEPIIANAGCYLQGGLLRTSGRKEIRFEGQERTRTRIVDYGNGTCDNEFTVSINGKLFTITGE